MVRACDAIENCSEQRAEFNLNQSSYIKGSSINISLTRPAANTSYIKYDFPLPIGASVNNPEQVAAVLFLLKNSSGEIKLVAEARPKDKAVISQIPAAPLPGDYKLYAQAHGWQGQAAKSDEISITIKDLPAAASSSPPVVAP